jgi:hypothetical protein
MFIYSTHKSYSVGVKHAAHFIPHKVEIDFNFLSFSIHYINEVFKCILYILRGTYNEQLLGKFGKLDVK